MNILPTPPEYLYKVMSLEQWQKSQDLDQISLSDDDANFIHLSTEEQLEHVVKKYWANSPNFIVIELEVSRLPGELVFEANEGGTTKYFHLYDGYLPKSAIASYEIRK